MKRFTYLAGGIVLLILFVVYRLMGITSPGPLDKVVQLALLGPSALLVSLFAASRIRVDLAEKLLGIIRGPSTGAFLGILLLLLAVFSVWMVYDTFEGIPKGGDEVAYYFQSKVYASGELVAPEPSVEAPQEYFPFRHFNFRDGTWSMMYTPCHSLLMAPFTAAGIAPLMGPLQGMLILVGIFLLIRLWTDETTARVSALLLLLSPFFLFMTTTFMAHNSNLLLVVWSLLLISKSVKRTSFLRSLAGGLLLGFAFTTKPYPITVWLLVIPVAVIFGCRDRWFRILAPAALGAAIPFALLLLSNDFYNGGPLVSGYEVLRGGNLIGFGPDKAWYPVYGDHAHTPIRGLFNVAKQIGVGSAILFGWPLISLVPMLLSLGRVRRDRRVLWLFVPLVMMMGLMSLHYSPSVDYGPRHYYTFLPIVILLSVLGLGEGVRLARGWKGRTGGNAVAVLVGLLFLISLVLYIPEGIRLRSGPWQAIESRPGTMAEGMAETPAIVFMQASEHAYPSICSGVNLNSPHLDTEIIYCAHQTLEEDKLFMEAYPGRSHYLYWFDGEDHYIEEWTEELAEEIVPTRDMTLYPHR